MSLDVVDVVDELVSISVIFCFLESLRRLWKLLHEYTNVDLAGHEVDIHIIDNGHMVNFSTMKENNRYDRIGKGDQNYTNKPEFFVVIHWIMDIVMFCMFSAY